MQQARNSRSRGRPKLPVPRRWSICGSTRATWIPRCPSVSRSSTASLRLVAACYRDSTLNLPVFPAIESITTISAASITALRRDACSVTLMEIRQKELQAHHRLEASQFQPAAETVCICLHSRLVLPFHESWSWGKALNQHADPGDPAPAAALASETSFGVVLGRATLVHPGFAFPSGGQVYFMLRSVLRLRVVTASVPHFLPILAAESLPKPRLWHWWTRDKVRKRDSFKTYLYRRSRTGG